MTVVGRLSSDGQLSVAGEINERLPVITDGLIAHFPFDGTVFDGVGGYLPTTMSEPNRNLIEANNLDWKDPSNWTRFLGTGTIYWDNAENALVMDGYYWGIFNGFISIDPSKHWYVEAEMKKAGTVGAMYLGDVSYKKDKITTTPQHPGTHEFFGAVGYTVPATWTRYNNNVIGGASRTGTSTVLDNYGAFDPECAFIRPLILANYSTGVAGTDKTYIKNFKWYCTDVDTSNCTLTNNGLAVEAEATNLFSNPNDLTVAPWNGGCVKTKVSDITPIGEITSTKLVYTGQQYIYQNLTVLPSLSYTYSIWLKATTNGQTIRFSFEGHTASGGYELITLKTEWTRFERTIMSTSTATAINFLLYNFTGDNNGNGCSIFACGAQCEQKTYATSYVNGNRPIAGKCFIPLTFTQNTNFAICVNVTGGRSDDGTCDIICDDSDRWNGQVRIGTNMSSGLELLVRTNARGATANLYSTLGGPLVNQIDGKKHCYIIQSIAGTGTKIYQDSNLVLNAPNYYVEYTSISIGRNGMGDVNTKGATYKDVSFYNKVLSQEEINKLSCNKLSITKDGNINSLKLIECLNNIPSDTYHFPLDFDDKDKIKLISPSTNTNTIYKDGSIWIGNSTTNILSDLTTNASGWGGMIATCTPSVSPFNTVMVNFNSTVSGGCEYYNSGGQKVSVPGGTYSISGYIKSSGQPSQNLFYLRQYRADGSQITEGGVFDYNKKEYKSDGWYLAYNTFTLNAECTKFLIQGYEYGVINIKVYGIMCSQTPFVSPFTNNTIGNGTLIIPTAGIIGSSSTIIISYIPMRSLNTTIISNATAGGQWWGVYDNGSIYMHEGTGGTSASSGVVATLGKLNQVAISWNDTTQYLYVNGILKTSLSTTGATNATNLPNLYIGYGWNRGDAYYKDLIIAKRCMTSTEILNIYKSTMKNSDATLQINNSITENSVLI